MTDISRRKKIPRLTISTAAMMHPRQSTSQMPRLVHRQVTSRSKGTRVATANAKKLRLASLLAGRAVCVTPSWPCLPALHPKRKDPGWSARLELGHMALLCVGRPDGRDSPFCCTRSLLLLPPLQGRPCFHSLVIVFVALPRGKRKSRSIESLSPHFMYALTARMRKAVISGIAFCPRPGDGLVQHGMATGFGV